MLHFIESGDIGYLSYLSLFQSVLNMAVKNKFFNLKILKIIVDCFKPFFQNSDILYAGKTGHYSGMHVYTGLRKLFQGLDLQAKFFIV